MNAYHPERVKHTGQDRASIGVMARTAEDYHDAEWPRRAAPVKATDFDRRDLLPADFSRRNMDLQLDDAKKCTGRLDQVGPSTR